MSAPAPDPGPLDDPTGTSDSYGVTDIGRSDLTWWIVGAALLGAIVLAGLGIWVAAQPVTDDGLGDGVAILLCFGAALGFLVVGLGYAVLVGAIGWLDRRDRTDRSDRTPPPP